MHDDTPDFVENFFGAIDLRAACAMTGLLGARTTHSHGIDSFEVAGIRNEMDIERLAGRGGVCPGGADVIFDVARAEHAAGIDIFKTRDDFEGWLTGDVGHHAEAAAVAHSHDGFKAAKFARGIENGIEQRNERRVAFQGKSFGAEIAILEDLLEEIRAHEALEYFFLIHFEFRTFDALGNPATAFGFRQVHEFHADCAAIVAASFFGKFAGETLKVREFQRSEKAKWIESGFVIAPAAEKVEDAFTFGVVGLHAETESSWPVWRLFRERESYG